MGNGNFIPAFHLKNNLKDLYRPQQHHKNLGESTWGGRGKGGKQGEGEEEKG